MNSTLNRHDDSRIHWRGDTDRDSNTQVVFKVVVLGLRREQARHLSERLPSTVCIRRCELRKILRLCSMNADFVLCTRFISHKITNYVAQVIGVPVELCYGGLGSLECAILARRGLWVKRLSGGHARRQLWLDRTGSR